VIRPYFSIKGVACLIRLDDPGDPVSACLWGTFPSGLRVLLVSDTNYSVIESLFGANLMKCIHVEMRPKNPLLSVFEVFARPVFERRKHALKSGLNDLAFGVLFLNQPFAGTLHLINLGHNVGLGIAGLQKQLASGFNNFKLIIGALNVSEDHFDF
jgi:hypothetical protein